MNFFKRSRNKCSSFSTTPLDHQVSQRRKPRRTLLQVLHSLCCTVRQYDPLPSKEPCMYEIPTVDPYYKSSVPKMDTCSKASALGSRAKVQVGDESQDCPPSKVLADVVLPYVAPTGDGVSVYDALSESDPRLSVSEWLGVACDVAGQLSALHKAGFVHTDLHNNNVLLYRNLQGPFSTGRSWQAKIISLESAKSINEASTPLELSDNDKSIYRQHLPHRAQELIDGLSCHSVDTDIYALGFLFAVIGYFRHIRILCTLAERCMEEDPSQRPILAVIARELTYFIRRYQRKERWGIDIKRRGCSIIDAVCVQKRCGYTKQRTIGVLIAEEKDLWEELNA